MKKVAAIAVLCAGALQAWVAPVLENVCNSAPKPNGTVMIHADITNAGPEDATSATLFYSLDNQASWTSVPMAMVGRPGYDSTHQASFTLPGSGTAYYYVRGENGTNYSTQLPLNSANTWPVGLNLLAAVANEPAGDTFGGARGAWLDITGAWLGYSGDRIYARITNNSNSWPTSQGPLGPWYVYSAGFRNPDKSGDTFGFVLTLANVLGIYTPGLFFAHKYDTTFTRIGDIDYQTNGNVLIMRGLISDLAARPEFGPWPIPSGYLTATLFDTRSANLSLQSWQHDTTTQCRSYVNRSPGFAIGANDAPSLSSARVVPQSGDPQTAFWFNVRYTDQDSNLPVRAAVVVDNDSFALAPANHKYWLGTTFSVTRSGFGDGWHRFHFVLDDGMAAVESPVDSFLVTSTGIAEQGTAAGSGLAAAPNPFSEAVALSGPRRPVRVFISNALGRLVRVLDSDGETTWDGRDGNGRLVPAGVYFCRLADRLHERLRLVRQR